MPRKCGEVRDDKAITAGLPSTLHVPHLRRFAERLLRLARSECGGAVVMTMPQLKVFGVLKRERVNRKHYLTRVEARSDIFDYIEWFYNQRKQRQLNSGNIHQPAPN